MDHAHLNILPIPDRVRLRHAASRYFPFGPTRLRELRAFVQAGQPYLFFSCPREGAFAAPAPIGSTQFFRKLLGAELSREVWDWRDDPNTEAVTGVAAWLRRVESTKP
jgi:hypothetical protein